MKRKQSGYFITKLRQTQTISFNGFQIFSEHVAKTGPKMSSILLEVNKKVTVNSLVLLLYMYVYWIKMNS